MAKSPDASLAKRRRRKMEPPKPPDRATQYALDVVAGRIITGELVRKACERHITDLATGHERGLVWSAEEAERAIEFYPLWHHYKGEWGRRTAEYPMGRPIVLESWQCFAVGSAFGWLHADTGLRRFRSVYIEVAAKNGKTLMAAGIAARLAWFDDEPAAEVVAAATKKDQAKIVWTDCANMIAKSPRASAQIKRMNHSSTLIDRDSESWFRPLGKDSQDTEQGVNIHGAIIDELHVHKDRDVIDNIEKATFARSQPMVVKITTAGTRSGKVWLEERADAVAVVEGRASDDSMLVLIYTLDEGDDPLDPEVWIKSNPSLGVTISEDTLQAAANKAARSPAKMAAFLRYHANVEVSSSTKAIDLTEWDKGDAEPEIPEGAAVYLGLDLASVRDLTALLTVHRDEAGDYHCDAMFWCPEDGIEKRSRIDGVPYDQWVADGWLVATPGSVTDYSFVRAAIMGAEPDGEGERVPGIADRYHVAEIRYDRWNATQLATELTNDGATCTAVSQTQAGIGPGWREVERLIVEGKIKHGGNPILRWMAGNVEVETDSAGNQKPSKGKSSERIDGIVGLTMGVGGWITHADEPALAPFVIMGKR